MTLQTQHTANAPATLTDEQRRRVADALENAQSVNTRRNYAGQFRKFCEWCEHRDRPRCRHRPKVVAAYPTELVSDGKSMSTVRLAVAAIVDAHRRGGSGVYGERRRQRDSARPGGTDRRQSEAGKAA